MIMLNDIPRRGENDDADKGYLPGLSWIDWTRPFPDWEPIEEKKIKTILSIFRIVLNTAQASSKTCQRCICLTIVSTRCSY